MIQNFVKFTLPHGVHVHPNDFREAVAKELDGQNFEGKSDMFNYANETTTNMKRPENRFLGGSGWLSFIADNDPTLIAKVIAPTIMFLTKEGINPQTYIGDKEKSAKLTYEPRVYRVTKLADQRDKARESKGVFRTPEQNVEYMITKMFEEAFNLGQIDQPIDKEDLHLKVLDVEKRGEEISFKNNTCKSIAKISATVSMNVELTGAWQAGHLQSRGYGLIYPTNHGGYTLCPI